MIIIQVCFHLQEVSATEAIQDEKLRHRPGTAPTNKDDESYVPPKSHLESAPKLESSGVGPRTDPITQQKRRRSVKIDDVSCAGLDGSPWPEDDRVADRKAQRAEQEADNKEYFKHHRASPLSEIKIADTRGMVSKASGGIAQSRSVGYEVGGGNVWRPEQLDTAEDSLRRAMEIFRANAARGDPDSPHGRVLREMRGEYW